MQFVIQNYIDEKDPI